MSGFFRIRSWWFAFLTGQLLRRGVHQSVQALEKDIPEWIKNRNQDPKPFVWEKTTEEILDSLARYISRISDAGHWVIWAQIGGRAVRPGR